VTNFSEDGIGGDIDRIELDIRESPRQIERLQGSDRDAGSLARHQELRKSAGRSSGDYEEINGISVLDE
jgi:hypothetical protein